MCDIMWDFMAAVDLNGGRGFVTLMQLEVLLFI